MWIRKDKIMGIEKKYNEIMKKIEKMSPREREDFYNELYAVCDLKTLEQEQTEKVIGEMYGEAVLQDISNNVAKAVLELEDLRKDGSITLTPEQEKLLDDLF